MTSAVSFGPRVLGQRQEMKLVMQNLLLTGRILPVGARLWIRHDFQCSEPQPVEVIYGFALPREAALRRYRISGEGFNIASELRPREEARKTYEEGIADGSLSSLAMTYGDGLTNLSVGNIRPNEKVVVLLEMLTGVELHDDGLRFRFPFTLAPCYHAKARVIESEPGIGEIELPENEFGDLILPKFSQRASDLHEVGFSLELQLGDDIQEIASPSHTIRVERDSDQVRRVSLARNSDLPDRDLVLDIRKPSSKPTVLSGIDSKGKGRFAAVLPSTEFGPRPSTPRRVAILLDRSGSMQGKPIEQAKKAIQACLGVLDEHDQFGLVVFSNDAEVFREHLQDATTANRRTASEFLDAVTADGGTEMSKGLDRAVGLLCAGDQEPDGDERGDLLIITDGQVFGTEAILERIRAKGTRVHCLGIGSASQDRFLAQLASQTGGVSRFATPAERVDLPAIELFGSIGRPVARIVSATLRGIEGARIAPESAKQVFVGTPLVVFGDTPVGGDLELALEWQNEANNARAVKVPLEPTSLADTLKLFQGSRLISDVESRCIPTTDPAKKRELIRLQRRLAELSAEYGLASSQTALVAVVMRGDDVKDQVPRTRVVPVGMPQDMYVADFFAAARPMASMAVGPLDQMVTGSFVRSRKSSQHGMPFKAGMLKRLFGGDAREGFMGSSEAQASADTLPAEDLLVSLSGMLEPDGGMPGKSLERRVTHSLVALLFFCENNNTQASGIFRMHVEKLLLFLSPERTSQLGKKQDAATRRILELLRSGQTIHGPWDQFVRRLVQSKTLELPEVWAKLDLAIEVAEVLARQNPPVS
jgi:Ca-activated chloride channel family protein